MKTMIALASLMFAGCGSPATSQDGGDDASDGTEVDADIPPPPDTSCGGTFLDLHYQAPSFLIVLDRSCSMRANTVPGTGGQSRWEVAVAALQTLVTTYATDIRWGLTLFPDTTGAACEQDAIPVPVADGTAPAITTLLQGALDPANPLYPDDPCVTNIDTGMAQVASDPAFADPSRERYVMLVSDGAQSGGAGANSCGGDARDATTTATIAGLHDQGITTFVVGFGGDVDTAALNEFAVAGGAPRAGTQKFYAANNANQLAAAFGSIGGLAVSCEYLVDPAPANLDETYVYFGNTELIAHDPTHAAGWDYDPTTQSVTFYGSECERLKTHAVTDVDIVFGCPMPPVL